MIDADRCDTIIGESAGLVGPVRVATGSCSGCRVAFGSAAAATLTELGWPSGDAQVVRYGVGGEYVTHTDGRGRDLAMMVQLSDPASYSGGRLEIDGADDPSTERGSVTEWCGQVPHRVTRVTEGERWALIAWRSARG